MKKFLLASVFLFIPSIAWAQCTGVFPANTVCGNTGGSPAVPTAQSPPAFGAGTVTASASSIVGDQALWGNFGGTVLIDSSAGVFNVRQRYKAIGDGSTDNSAAITSAFTASNTTSPGIPTVYFDCNTNTTTCTYNYTGALSSGSVSSINPTIPTTLLCAPGVTLNYTGVGHAADIGPVGGAANPQQIPYTIYGCRWTAGTSLSAGIFFQPNTTATRVQFNTFSNFGTVNGSVAALIYTGNQFEPQVSDNLWWDTDGFPRSMVDSHIAQNSSLIFTNNHASCLTAGFAACSVVTSAYGVWTPQGTIANNNIAFHFPDVRLGSCNTCGSGGIRVVDNVFEGQQASSPTPAITYGDPGGTARHMPNFVIVVGNTYFGTNTCGVSTLVGPETPAAGSYVLDNLVAMANFSQAPCTGTPFINTNGGVQGVYAFNYANSGPVDQTTTPSIFDASGAGTSLFPLQFFGGQTNAPSHLAAFDAKGQFINTGTWTQVSATLDCTNTAASNTMSCTTNPAFTPNGTSWPPVAGNLLVFTSTFTNTSSVVTLAVNGTSPFAVHKQNGANLANGDITNGIPVLLTFDGTNWNLH